MILDLNGSLPFKRVKWEGVRVTALSCLKKVLKG